MTRDEWEIRARACLLRAAARLSLVKLGEMTPLEAVADLRDIVSEIAPGTYCACACADFARAERDYPHRRRAHRRAA